jgi:hypothetical protein
MGVVTTKTRVGKAAPEAPENGATALPLVDPGFKTWTVSVPLELAEEVERWAVLGEVSLDVQVAELLERGLGRTGVPTKQAKS